MFFRFRRLAGDSFALPVELQLRLNIIHRLRRLGAWGGLYENLREVTDEYS